MQPLIDDSNLSVLQGAFYSAGIIVAVSLLLFLQLLVVREINVVRRRRRERFLGRWHSTMLDVVYTQPENLPRLRKKETLYFIDEWNKIYDRLSGKARERLIKIADDVDIRPVVRLLLNSKRTHLRLTGIVTIGHLRDEAAWDQLEQMTLEENSIVSLAATRALIQINAERSINSVIDVISQRQDWPSSHVANIMREAGPQVATKPLTEATEKAEESNIPYLMKFFSYIDASKASKTIDNILKKTVDDRVIGACIQASNDVCLLNWVRKYIDYPRWHVRVHAASALGRMGSEKDLPLLVSLLSDSQWWVRYRAAQAITRLPFVDRDKLNLIFEEQTDRFARDIMSQVIAETHWT